MRRLMLHIGLFMLLLFGWMLTRATLGGWFIVAVPVLVWSWPFLRFIHKSRWAALCFWAAAALICWPAALVGLGVVFLARFVAAWKQMPPIPRPEPRGGGRSKRINPASGLPMVGQGVDAGGNPIGRRYGWREGR